MVILNYIVEDLEIRQKDNKYKYIVPVGIQDSVGMQFDLDDEWLQYTRFYLQFYKSEEECYKVELDASHIGIIPAFLSKGVWKVNLYAVAQNNVTRLVSQQSDILITAGYNENGKVPEPPEEDYYTQLWKKMEAEGKEVAKNLQNVKDTVATIKKFEEITVNPDDTYSVLLLDKNNEGSKMSFVALADYLKIQTSENVELKKIMDLIENNKFKDEYQNGDIIMSTFTYNGTVYDYPFIIINNDAEITEIDGNVLQHRVCIEPYYTTPFGVQFSQYRAFLRCPGGLAAGSYKVTFAQAWSKLTVLTWYFTITHAVPSGGRLAGFRNFADGQSNTAIYTYGNDGKLLYTDNTITSAEIADAVDLGTINYTTRNGNLNCMQEVFFGWNEYLSSAVRQVLNSDELNWWVPQDEWDCEPDFSVNGNKGYLSYLDPDLVKLFKIHKVDTLYNYVQGHSSGEYYTIYDKVAPLSLEEAYIAPFVSGIEGSVMPYWKERSGSETPVVKWSMNVNYIQYSVSNHTSAQYVWYRSALLGGASYEFLVDPSGYVGTYYARCSLCLSPRMYL